MPVTLLRGFPLPPLRRSPCYCSGMTAALRILLVAVLSLAFSLPAAAHPHVWVKTTSELVYAPDGSVTGIRHHWVFDDMFTAFALQGIESKEKGKFTPAELAPLAKVNVESLKEYDYFTFATADGKKTPLGEPLADYALDYKDEILTLNFTLPFKQPVKAKDLKIEIYDPTYFIAFELAKDTPAKLVGAPAQCKLTTELPRELTFQEGKALAQIPVDQKKRRHGLGLSLRQQDFGEVSVTRRRLMAVVCVAACALLIVAALDPALAQFGLKRPAPDVGALPAGS